jgi:DNA-binding MarR family transcriptional regulator
MEHKQRTQINHLLFQVLRTIFHYERSIAKSYGLDFQQIHALQYLRRHPNARLTEISSEMDQPKFTIGRLLSRLETSGYISKTQDLADRRNSLLQLEEKGQRVLEAIETASYARITTIIKCFSQSEMSKFVEVAEHLDKVLGVTDKISIVEQSFVELRGQ